MSRGGLAAGLLLVSASLAQANDHAVFSPLLVDPPLPAAAAAPAAPDAAQAAPAPPARGKAGRRRTRLARGRHHGAKPTAEAAVELPAPGPDGDGAKTLTIGSIPAPLPPSHEADVAGAIATLETPPARKSSGNVEAASGTPSSPRAGGGPTEFGSETVAALLARNAFENGIPLSLAQAVVRIESRGNAHAQNHGALGLMQIKYGTARAVGFAGPAVGLFVAETNLRYGMKVLAQAYRDARGDICGALMRYQSGHMSRHPSAANRAYCAKAHAYMAKN